MKIAFDAICLGDGPVTGVARSFLNGLDAYAEQWADDMIVLVPEGGDQSELPDVRAITAPRGALPRQRTLPRLLGELGADILHSSVAAVPLRSPCPTIATVHDLPWLHAESGERSTWWRRFATTRALRAASAVIAPSTFTLEAAARLLGDGSKLHRVPHTTKANGLANDSTARTGPFVVFGDDRPRKNRARVHTAHQIAREQNPELPDLRFVGPPDDYISEEAKAELLRTCRAVVSCSLYEGFGMPVLEALTYGAPLVCSDIPPHREIAGDGAIFVDPLHTESIAEGIVRCFLEPMPQQTPLQPVAPPWRALHELLVTR